MINKYQAWVLTQISPFELDSQAFSSISINNYCCDLYRESVDTTLLYWILKLTDDLYTNTSVKHKEVFYNNKIIILPFIITQLFEI